MLIRAFQKPINKINLNLIRNFSLLGKFTNLKPDRVPGGPPRPDKVTLTNFKMEQMRTRQPLIKQNPLLSEMSPNTVKEDTIRDARAEAAATIHASKYMEKCVQMAMDSSINRDWNVLICSLTRMFQQLSKKFAGVSIDDDAEDDIYEMTGEVDTMIKEISIDIRAINQKLGAEKLPPHILTEIMAAYNIIAVPVVEQEDFNTSLFDVTLLTSHISNARESIQFNVKDEKLSYIYTEEVPVLRISSSLLATVYSIIYSRNGYLSGVVHTPHIGLVYLYNSDILPKGVPVHKSVHRMANSPSPPYHMFGVKLKPCNCRINQCSCFDGTKHVYVDILARRIGWLLKDVPDVDGKVDPPVPFYSYPALALRIITEGLYVEDIHSANRNLIQITAKRFEEFIKYEYLGEPVPPEVLARMEAMAQRLADEELKMKLLEEEYQREEERLRREIQVKEEAEALELNLRQMEQEMETHQMPSPVKARPNRE